MGSIVPILLLVVDQILKAVSLYHMRAWGTNGVFVFEMNTSTLFYSDWLGLFVAGIAIVLLARMYPDLWAMVVLAGIGSNFVDGFLRSAVIDYIRLPGMPFCFNLADVYILAGVVMLIWGATWKWNRSQPEKRS